MKQIENVRTTFAQDTKMTPGIIRIIARILNGKPSTFKERREARQKYLKPSSKVEIKLK